MSYDVFVLNESFNYTWNMRQFFVDFCAYPGDWDGIEYTALKSILDRAIEEIESEDMDSLRSRYDAPNGWGDVPSALEWLRKIRDVCDRGLPSTKVSVWK